MLNVRKGRAAGNGLIFVALLEQGVEINAALTLNEEKNPKMHLNYQRCCLNSS